MVEMPKEFVPEHVMDEPKTFTGNRALSIEEPLIFEIGSPETSGVDFEDPPHPVPLPKGRGDARIVRRAVDKSAASSLSPRGEGWGEGGLRRKPPGRP